MKLVVQKCYLVLDPSVSCWEETGEQENLNAVEPQHWVEVIWQSHTEFLVCEQVKAWSGSGKEMKTQRWAERSTGILFAWVGNHIYLEMPQTPPIDILGQQQIKWTVWFWIPSISCLFECLDGGSPYKNMLGSWSILQDQPICCHGLWTHSLTTKMMDSTLWSLGWRSRVQ